MPRLPSLRAVASPALGVAVFGLALLVLLRACAADGEEAAPSGEGGPSAFRFEREPHRVRHDVPLGELLKGIPVPDPRDQIPAILEPRFISVAAATGPLRDDARVIAVVVRGREGASSEDDGEEPAAATEDARAYPLWLLDRHELVNDVVGGRPLLVTWCPLCGSSAAFEREVEGRLLTFGVSGYLWQSDVLMYDHQTESFWSQIGARAVVGPLTGTRLTLVPSTVTTWGAFRRSHPDGKVLGPDQGLLPSRAYEGDAYASYRASPDLMFPVRGQSDALPRKAEVVGLVLGEHARAWPLADLRRIEGSSLADDVGGVPVVVHLDREADAVRVTDADGGDLPALRIFWFAWYAFHPDASLWRPAGSVPSAGPSGR